MRRPFDHDPESVTRARIDAGLTKTALARMCECSLSLISEIEGGTRNARMPLLTKIAQATGRPVSELTRVGTDESERQATAPADVAHDLPELRG